MSNEMLYQNVDVQENDQSEVTITALIPAEQAQNFRERALKHLGKDLELPGFRKGHVPEKVLLERLGEQALWEEIAEMAIAEAYPQILREKELQVIGRPRISVTKLAPNNPIAFTIEAALEPSITLPDYKAIAQTILKEPDDLEVTDKEFDDVILNLRKNKWRIDNKEKAANNEEPDEKDLPELTDELVQNLGDFKDVAAFTAKLREDLRAEKERRAREKKRIAIGEAIIEAATVPLPRILIDSELEGMLKQFQADVERAGATFDDYLKHINKTEEDLRKEWEDSAKKRAQLQLILNAIAEQEKILPDPARVMQEIEHLKAQIKDADEERLRLYVLSVLQNEAVFNFLEEQKK